MTLSPSQPAGDTMMKRLLTLSSLLLLIAVAACSSPDSDPASMEVVEFYGALNEAQYEQALGHYNDGLRQSLSNPDSGFDEWATAETKDGSIEKIEIKGVEELEGEKTVTYKIVYKDGSSVDRSVSLTGADDDWELGFIR
jgi:hypothetical protein